MDERELSQALWDVDDILMRVYSALEDRDEPWAEKAAGFAGQARHYADLADDEVPDHRLEDEVAMEEASS